MAEQPYRIDVHHHIIPPDYVGALSEIGVSSSLGVNLPPWSAERALLQNTPPCNGSNLEDGNLLR